MATVQCLCGRRFQARDELRGKRVRCPACKQPLTIPGTQPAQSQAAAAPPMAEFVGLLDDQAWPTEQGPALGSGAGQASPLLRRQPGKAGSRGGKKALLLGAGALVGVSLVGLLVALVISIVVRSGASSTTVAQADNAPPNATSVLPSADPASPAAGAHPAAASGVPAAQAPSATESVPAAAFPATPASSLATPASSLATPAPDLPQPPSASTNSPLPAPAPAAPFPVAPVPAPAAAAAPPPTPADMKAAAEAVAAAQAARMPPPELTLTEIAIPGGGAIALSTVPSPLAAVGGSNSGQGNTQLWNLDKLAPAGVLLVGRPSFPRQALSPDGKYLAGNVVGKANPTVSIWSFESGKEVRQIELQPKPASLHVLSFTKSGQLLASTLGGNPPTLQLWDPEQGAKVGEFAVRRNFDEASLAFSPDGAFLALFASPNVYLYDVAEGKELTSFTTPEQPHSYIGCKGLRFTPDGHELAGVFFNNEETIVYGWSSADRSLSVEHKFQGDLSLAVRGAQGYKGPALEWLPDGRGYLLYGHELVDRRSGRLVWFVLNAPDDFSPLPRCVLSADRLLVATSQGFGRALPMQVLKLPWAAIEASLKAMSGKEAAIVRPGQAVSLQVEVGAVRGGTPEQTKADLVKLFTERLAADGVGVAEGQTTVLKLKYEETTGTVLNEVVGGRPGPLGGGVATGRTVQGTRGICHLEYTGPGGEAFWANVLDLDLKTVASIKQPSEAAARDATFAVLTRQLRQQPIPYFVPKDLKLVPLPGSTQLPSAKK